MKGILLAGGQGTRLYPITKAVSKQLLPIYDKPMFYYPLATLMEAGIREIMLISNPKDLPAFQMLLGDGSSLGISIEYAAQPFPLGIADALRIGRNFSAGERTALILGDNLFIPGMKDREAFSDCLKKAVNDIDPVIFTVSVDNPQEFGVAEIDENGQLISIEEKPENPRSNSAVPGLYFYPPGAADLVDTLNPSARGELEISDLNQLYLSRKRLKAIALPSSMNWLDTGTISGLLTAINLIADLNKSGCNPGCIEKVAQEKGFINKTKLLALASQNSKSDYGRRLIALSKEASNV